MADRILTLKPETDPEDNIYPNIKRENIPDGAVNDDKISAVSWGKVTGKPLVPTKTSQLENDSGFVTGSEVLPKNGRLTIKVNGQVVQTFTANQEQNVEVDISIPTNTITYTEVE